MVQERVLTYRAISDLKLAPRNPRKHARQQIIAIARSIESFGFNAPILVDRHGQVVAGHGRLEAARKIGLEKIPVIGLEDLTEAQAQAYMLADNKLTDRSSWDEDLLAAHLRELSSLACDFELEDTGFESPEIDFLIQGLDSENDEDGADDFSVSVGPSVSKLGELWTLGRHRIYCGDARQSSSYRTILNGEMAAAVFTDLPYNVRINGNVSGLGKARHREFVMASGEMSKSEFTEFLTNSLSQCKAWSLPGALIYACMDWRHFAEIESARATNDLTLLNVCVWVKSNGGMGAFYRSRHELIFVFRNGSAPHRNNVQLGKFGRNRTNVWNYPGASSFPKRGQKDDWQAHPTVKPLRLVADAILDSTIQDDILLDPFAGSGTTLLACERTCRQARVIELDSIYVDTAIKRWQDMTGLDAQDETGVSFNERRARSLSDE